MKINELEENFNKNLTLILIIAIIGVGSFLAGSNYKPKASEQKNIKAEDTASSSSLINEIKNSSQNTSSPTVPSATSAAAKTSTTYSGLVNINTANEAELDTLPGVGPVTAKAIIDYRNAHGAYSSINDLDNVKGIGPATISKLQDKITL